jgi:TrmH family RNA methyltransferase
MEPLGFSNPQIQRLRRLLGRRSARWDEGAFVVEGATLVEEAVRAGWEVEVQFVAPGATGVPGLPTRALAPGVLERVATTESPQPVLAVVRMRNAPPPDHPRRVLVGAGLSDPGNLGTILRSAEAAGFDLVALTPGSVDPYSPKTVRASAGAIFHVPVVVDVDPTTLGVELVGTSSHIGEACTSADLSSPLAIVIGNEAHGVPADVPVQRWITIPHEGRAESLNAAMAATLVVFEVMRQQGRTSRLRGTDE